MTFLCISTPLSFHVLSQLRLQLSRMAKQRQSGTEQTSSSLKGTPTHLTSTSAPHGQAGSFPTPTLTPSSTGGALGTSLSSMDAMSGNSSFLPTSSPHLLPSPKHPTPSQEENGTPNQDFVPLQPLQSPSTHPHTAMSPCLPDGRLHPGLTSGKSLSGPLSHGLPQVTMTTEGALESELATIMEDILDRHFEQLDESLQGMLTKDEAT